MLAASACVLVSCQSGPAVYTTLSGGQFIFPDQIGSRPTVLAFLSANDRRCDKEIPTLWAFSKRPGAPAQIIGVVDYDDHSFLQQVSTLQYASFPMILDPEGELVRRFGVDAFPTYVFLDWTGDEIDRAADLGAVSLWIDDRDKLERALPKPAAMKPAE